MSAATGPRKRRWPLLIALLVLALVALPLAFYTPDIPAATLRAKYTTPASQFITVAPGLAVHVRDEGPRDAPVLVLLHGSNASLQAWEPWVRLLKDKYRIISFDLPGHGLTGPNPTRDYSAAGFGKVVGDVVAAKQLTRFVLGGNSMGGWIAWTYAARHPDQIAGLVLVDAAGAVSKTTPNIPIGFKIARMPVLRDLAKVITPRALVEKSLRQTVTVQTMVTPQRIDEAWELLRYPGNRAATIDRFATPRIPIDPADLARITAPVLILWGSQDRLIPVDSAAWFSKHLRQSRVIIYDDVGHLPMEEAPERSAADVRTFLDALQTTPTPGPTPAR